MVDIEDLKVQLISEYSPALETSLVIAIVSDFDLADQSQLKAAQDTLEELQKSALKEEATGFDESASSGLVTLVHNEGEGHWDCTESGSGQRSWSSSTDDTVLTQGISAIDIDGSSSIDKNGEEATYGAELDALHPETKESILLEMFPDLKPFDIKWTLKKDKWDINKAINNLMTQSFMEESGTRQHGIEAFSETDLPLQNKKAKRKKGKNDALNAGDLSSPITPDSPTGSKWDMGKQDVEFIATRTGKSPEEIGSLYHKNGASIRATIVSVLEAQIALKIPCDDPLIECSAIDLGHEFPNLPPHLLKPLIQITHPSTANAHELARDLVYQSTKSTNIQIEFRHAPLELDAALPKPKVPATSNLGLTLETATGLATKYSKEREDAFMQARAAYRKGKSDHLMGGAAAYYSEVVRTAESRLKSAQSAAADALVASNSSKSQLDLHGVNVQDAKRIAKERVTSWWHELGESRISGRLVAAEYRIVTGVGYHSEGGKSKLAPAVLRMLMQDGWKVQVGTGVLVVTGIAKRK